MNERKTNIKTKALPYRRANKQTKFATPNEVVALTGYHRTCAAYRLRTAAAQPPPRKRTRQDVGYARLEGEEAVRVLKALCAQGQYHPHSRPARGLCIRAYLERGMT